MLRLSLMGNRQTAVGVGLTMIYEQPAYEWPLSATDPLENRKGRGAHDVPSACTRRNGEKLSSSLVVLFAHRLSRFSPSDDRLSITGGLTGVKTCPVVRWVFAVHFADCIFFRGPIAFCCTLFRYKRRFRLGNEVQGAFILSCFLLWFQSQ